jgi:hypothetical protein
MQSLLSVPGQPASSSTPCVLSLKYFKSGHYQYLHISAADNRGRQNFLYVYFWQNAFYFAIPVVEAIPFIQAMPVF